MGTFVVSCSFVSSFTNSSVAQSHPLPPVPVRQTYILFRAQLKPPYSFGAGPETIESKFFKLEDIPFSELAFSSVRYTLEK